MLQLVPFAVCLCGALSAAEEIPPVPLFHLMPPSADSIGSQTFPQGLVRWLLPGPQTTNQAEYKGRTGRWAGPSPEPKGQSARAQDCDPCNRAPWVPVARQLGLGPSVPAVYHHNGHQYAVSIPTIGIAAIPVQYGSPVPAHPSSQYGPPDGKLSQQGPPNINSGPPKLTYRPPVTRPPNYTQNVPLPPKQFASQTTSYGVPPKLMAHYGPAKPVFGPSKPEYTAPRPPYNPPRRPQFTVPMKTHQIPILNSPSVQYDGSLNSYHLPPKGTDFKTPIQSPIPFPQLSKFQVPPLLNSAQFNTNSDITPFLEPPRLEPEAFSESDKNCGRCHVPSDSIPSSAQFQTRPLIDEAKHQIGNFGSLPLSEGPDSYAQPTNQGSGNNDHTSHRIKGSNVEVVKSVPLAEYLSSIEYPMQVIQAPLLDMSGLPNYFQLYQPVQKETFIQKNQGHALFVQGLEDKVKDNVKEPASYSVIENTPTEGLNAESVPANHKEEEAGKIIDISERPPVTISTGNSPTSGSPGISNVTPYHGFITNYDIVHSPPTEATEYVNVFNTSTLAQQSNTDLRNAGPDSGYNPGWTERGQSSPATWSTTPPRPFNQVPSQHKKTKQIHQIIVPYLINRRPDTQGWTPIPIEPRNIFGQRFQEGLKQSDANISLAATGSEHVEQRLHSLDGLDLRNLQQLATLPPHIVNQMLKYTGTTGEGQSLAANLQALLQGEEDSVDLLRLQKNIDNWTAEGYRQSQEINHITTNSKNIPHEYLSTSTLPENDTDRYYRSSSPVPDYEASGSQNHLIKAAGPHYKAAEIVQHLDNDTDGSFITELNGWSLPDNKLVLPRSSTPVVTSTSPDSPMAQPTTVPWQDLHVSISPLTKEKVYVVTPQPAVTTVPAPKPTISSGSALRVERSFTVHRTYSTSSEKYVPVRENFIDDISGKTQQNGLITDKEREKRLRRATQNTTQLNQPGALAQPIRLTHR